MAIVRGQFKAFSTCKLYFESLCLSCFAWRCNNYRWREKLRDSLHKLYVSSTSRQGPDLKADAKIKMFYTFTSSIQLLTDVKRCFYLVIRFGMSWSWSYFTLEGMLYAQAHTHTRNTSNWCLWRKFFLARGAASYGCSKVFRRAARFLAMWQLEMTGDDQWSHVVPQWGFNLWGRRSTGIRMTSLRCGPFDQLNQLKDKVCSSSPENCCELCCFAKKTTRTWSFAKQQNFGVQSCSKALDEAEESDWTWSPWFDTNVVQTQDTQQESW